MAITKERFDAYAGLAMELGICFCMCKCENDAKAASILGNPVPGLCDSCKVKKGHERIATMGMWEAAYNPIVEDLAVKVERPVREVSPEAHARAVAYIESVEPHTRDLAVLSEKVASGKPLTARQVEKALEAEAVEARDYTRAHKRLLSEHVKRATDTDLTRVHIPETIKDGRYAVEADSGDVVLVDVARTYDGALRGATVVCIHLGDTKWYGVQRVSYPGFLGRVFPAVYKGWFPQLIADLVADPDIARETYEDMAA